MEPRIPRGYKPPENLRSKELITPSKITDRVQKFIGDIGLKNVPQGGRLRKEEVTLFRSNPSEGVELFSIQVHGNDVAEYAYSIDNKKKHFLENGIERFTLIGKSLGQDIKLQLIKDDRGNSTIKATPPISRENNLVPLEGIPNHYKKLIADIFGFGESN